MSLLKELCSEQTDLKVLQGSLPLGDSVSSAVDTGVNAFNKFLQKRNFNR